MTCQVITRYVPLYHRSPLPTLFLFVLECLGMSQNFFVPSLNADAEVHLCPQMVSTA
jgi:hypothetical protein